MPDFDLSAFQTQSEQQLHEIIRHAQAELRERQEAKRRRAEDEIKRILAENDLDPADFFAKLTKGKKKKKSAAPSSPAKYRNPENPDETWNGLGRKPKWFLDAKNSGITEEQMAIAS